MLSKAKIKYIRSLELKKNRDREGVFVAEGPKVVADLLRAMPCRLLVHEAGLSPESLAPGAGLPGCEVAEATGDELRRASFLQHPQQVLAVFAMRSGAGGGPGGGGLTLALDGVRDPGNLGTIVRTADWFGVERIVCSPDTADVYNPKVVQATMGSLARVAVSYTPLAPWLRGLREAGVAVYGTLLDGDDIRSAPLTPGGVVVMGNEGRGLSPEVRALVSVPLLIPSYPAGRPTAESLNVAVATALTLGEFRRRRN